MTKFLKFLSIFGPGRHAMSVGPKYGVLGCFRCDDAHTSSLQRNIYSSRCIGMSVAQEERFSRIKGCFHSFILFFTLWFLVRNPRCAGYKKEQENNVKIR